MKNVRENDTIQIEITNACINNCANCTRFTSSAKSFFMDFDTFKNAVDSLVEFPFMTGMMGGEPLLHPEFEKFCEYALSKIPRERLGLWTCLPVGYENYREVIVNTFGNVFINDHSRQDIYHHPFLVASQDVIADEKELYYRVDSCEFQNNWSASINPKGAYFCEMAASFAMLYESTSNGWEVEKDWWKRTTKDYTSQIEEFCKLCGGALFLNRRSSKDKETDISPTNKKLFEENHIYINSIDHSLQEVEACNQEPLAAYKDQEYRNHIASRYGIFLTTNKNGFNEPYLMNDINNKDSILSKFQRRYIIGK